MIQVLLIDDEEIIINGLKEFIHWEKYGMCITGMADDGEKGLGLMEKLSPDVVITDIKMPKMDGLEFLKEAKKKFPDCIFVFISGYDNFHYAQSAIRLGAYDYILKPIDIDHFQDLLKQIEQEIKAKQNLFKRNGNVRYDVKKDFLMELIYNGLHENDTTRRADSLGLNKYKHFQIIVFQINTGEQSPRLKLILTELEKKTVFHGAVLFSQIGDNELIAICMCSRKIDLENLVGGLLSETRLLINGFQFEETAGVGTIENRIADIHKSFKSAKECLQHKYSIGKGIDIFFTEQKFAGKRELPLPEFRIHIENIVKNLKYLKSKCLLNELMELKELVKECKDPHGNAQIVITEIFSCVLNMLDEFPDSMRGLFQNMIQENSRLLQSETMEETFLELEKILSRIIELLKENKNEKRYNLELKIREYININYKRPGLTLSEVAEYTSFSTNYFSFIFKESFKKTFVDFLTDIRIDKAKELLLLSDLNISEISEKIGYENPSYFSSVFKRRTGFTPNDFRNYAFQSQGNENAEKYNIKKENI